MLIDESEFRTSFVNREKDISILKWLVGNIFEEKGNLILIEGEIGIGKTRLVEEIHNWIAEDDQRDIRFLNSRCLYYGSCDPYLPFLDALKGYYDKTSGKQPAMPNLIAGEMGQPNSTSAEVGGSGSLLSGTEIMDLRHLKEERDRMFENTTEIIIRISQEKPLVLFIDDIHWADNPSLQLLQYLARNTKNAAVLIIIAYRPEELRKVREEANPFTDIMHNMKRENLYTKLVLNRLERQYVAEMIHSIFGHSNVPIDFIDQIYDITEGNPYFVEEVIRSFIEERIVDPQDQKWYEKIDTSRISVPETIRDVIIRRTKRLERDSLKILRYAALIGRVFEFKVLHAVSEMDEERLLDCLEELVHANLIHEDLDSDDECYRFDNTIICEVAYDDLSRSRRRVIHRKVAETLEDIYANDKGPVVYDLARHFYRGKSYPKAMLYLKRAGELAESLYAIEEAQNYYLMSLDAMLHLDDDPDTMKQRVTIVDRLGTLFQIIGDWQKAVECHEKAIDLINEAEEGLKKAIPDKTIGQEEGRSLEKWMSIRRAEAFRKLGNIRRFQARYEEAVDCYKHALSISHSMDDHYGIAEANRGLGYVHWRKGEYEKAIGHYDRTMENMDHDEETPARGVVYIELGNVYNSKGDWLEAVQYYEKAIEELGRTGNLREMARAYNNLGDIFIQREKWEKAIMYCSESENTAKKIGNLYMMGWSSFNQAECYANMGDFTRALEKNHNAFDCLSPLDDKVGVSSINRNFGTIYRLLKDWEKATEYYEKCVGMLGELNIPFELGYAYYEFGLMYRDMGEKEKAKEYVGKALRCFEKVGAKKRIEIIESEWSGL